MIADNRPPSSDANPPGASRANLWLGGTALVLLGAVVTLVVVLLQRDGAAPAATGASSLASVLGSPTPAAGASAQAPDGSAADAGASAPKPYVNLLDPKHAPPAPGAAPPGASPPAAPAPDPADPLDSLVQGLGGLFDDPGLTAALKDLGKSLQKSASLLGQAFGGTSARGSAPKASPPSGGGQGQGSGSGSDPLAQLLNRAFSIFGGGSGAGGLFGGQGSAAAGSGRIVARVADSGHAYVVSCTFPRGAPESASFRVRGETLVIKARFAGRGDEEQEVELPGPVHPTSARSELKDGALVVTLPKS